MRDRSLPPCAFCGLATELSEDEQGVTHEVPHCQTFRDLEPHAFLRACGEVWQRKIEQHDARTKRLYMLLGLLKAIKVDPKKVKRPS